VPIYRTGAGIYTVVQTWGQLTGGAVDVASFVSQVNVAAPPVVPQRYVSPLNIAVPSLYLVPTPTAYVETGLSISITATVATVTESAKYREPCVVTGTPYLYPTTGRATTPDPGIPPYPFHWLAKLRGPQSTSASDQYVASQGAASGSYSYELARRGTSTATSATGAYVSSDGTNRFFASATAPIDKVNPQYIAASIQDDTVNTRAIVYTSPDGTTWTQYGSNSNTRVTALFDSNDVVRIGGRANDTSLGRWDDRIYWVEMRSGLTIGGGTLLWRFDASEWGTSTTLVDPRGLTWTLSAAGAIVQPPGVEATVTSTDIYRQHEPGLSIPITATVTCTDALRHAYQDLGLSITIAAAVTATDVAHRKEIGLSLPIVGTTTTSDIIHRKELALSVAIAATVACTDTYHAGSTSQNYNETGRVLAIAATTTLPTTSAHYHEIGTPTAAPYRFAEDWNTADASNWDFLKWPHQRPFDSISGGVGMMATGGSPTQVYGDTYVEDFEMTVKMTWPSSIGGQYPEIAWRVADGMGNIGSITAYAIQINGSGNGIDIFKIGAYSSIGSASDASLFAAGTRWFKIRVVGNNHKVKWWLDGSAEPGTWNIDATDATPLTDSAGLPVVGGGIGFRYWGATQIWYDDLTVTDLNSTPLPIDGSLRMLSHGKVNMAGNANVFNVDTDLTWCCWFKTTSLVVGCPVMSLFNGGSNYCITTLQSDGVLRQYMSTGDFNIGTTLSLNTWYFIALSRSITGGSDLYWAPQGTTTLSSVHSASVGVVTGQPLRLLSDEYGSSPYEMGAAFKVWKAALTQAQLEAEMATYSAVRTANLFASWPMRNGLSPYSENPVDNNLLLYYEAGGMVSGPVASFLTDAPVPSGGAGSGLAIAVAAVTTATDKKAYAELALSIPIAATVTETDLIHRKELSLPLPVAATVTETGGAHFKELALSLPIAAVVAVNDAFGHLGNFSDLNLSIPISGAVVTTSKATLKELVRSIPVAATITRTDVYTVGSSPLIQEGFRWRNDDGSETTATWLAAQDTNASLALASAARLRMVVDSAADQSFTPTLYYKKSTDSTWLPVPVGAGGGGPVYIATSPNVTAGGQATTALLTSPSGKTTTDFSVGRMWDDENGSDVLTLSSGGGGTTPVTMTMQRMKPSAALNENLTVRAKVLVTADGNVPGQGAPPGYGNTNQPVGTVTFYDGGVPMLTTLINIFGEADVVRDDLSVGTHNITATYNGTATYATASAGPVVQTITAAKVAPTLSTWQANYDSYDLAKITEWYQYNTGHLAQGFDHSTLWNPAGGSSLADVEIDAAWLAANAAAGKVVNTGGSNWTITGLRSSRFEIRVSNLIFNHCLAKRVNFATVWGGGFGFYQVGVGTDNITITNVTFNYCTGFTDGTGVESGGWGTNIGTYGDAMGYDPATPAPNQVVFNYCEFSQWRAGFLTQGGVTANYCWVHTLDLYGLDPHNTSGSIRDQYTTFYRNLFCDGTSSDISLYADNNPYTNFWLTENILWLDGDHASQEINFPVRGTGWSPLLPGYVRECVGNLAQDGSGGDFAYFSKVAGNRMLGAGKKIWGCADAVQTTNDPSVLTLMPPSEYFGHASVYDTYTFTPSPNSTLFLFQGTGQFAHATTPSLAVTDSAGGGSWAAVTGASTPIEGYWGNTNYGMSASLVTQQPGATPVFRHLTIDPYSGSSAEGVAATMVVEVTGRTGMTLAKPVVLSAKGNATSFGAHLGTFSSGTLASPATSGHLVMWFIAFRHDLEGGIPAPPAGWFMTGNNWDREVGTALLWRRDFTGSSVTISDMGVLDVAVSILCEFN
jgi:hypothetical protein